MHVAAIIAAGGRGRRVGSDIPKQLLDLGDGTIMLSRSIEAMMKADSVDEIVLALGDGMGFGRDDTDTLPQKPITVTAGGARRQDSVANALAAVSDAADFIVIHDAARPFVTVDLIERTVRAARDHGAAIAAVPVADTVKQVTASGDVRLIRGTLPRETIFLAQTPQAFRRDILTQALAAARDDTVTDEATLVERAGFPVHVVDGDATNVKVTTREDLNAVRARLSSGERAVSRIGTGYDLHRLVEGRRLILGGVHIPFDRGLQGHSDADIVCHAVTDALLGAAAIGDIGRLFPDTSREWKDAESIKLLHQAMSMVDAVGFSVSNVDVTIIAERPKLLPYLEPMRANLARALGVDVSAVSIKGKTNEGVGEIGRGEAMACHAVTLITFGARKHRNTEK